jgi:LmbE family N-acetylglucosaminyl deacetylase
MTRRVCGSLLAVTFAAGVAGQDRIAVAQNIGRPRLVAVFAHPDDENAVGPLLARYARERIDVRLVLATNGDRGRGVSNLTAGEALGRARAQEAICSAERLGINPPVLLDLGDGTLAVPATLRRLETDVARVLKELGPAAVVTWGGEGLDGHPDHRIVGAVVTEIVQGWADGDPPPLFYPGFPRDRTLIVPDSPFSQRPTLERFLTVRVPFEPRDFEANVSAFSCHQTQYTPQQRETGLARLMKLMNGSIYLRPALAEQAPWPEAFR